MARSVIKQPTVAGLQAIYVEKPNVNLPEGSFTQVDISSYIPSCKTIKAISNPKLGNYVLPYYDGDGTYTQIIDINAQGIVKIRNLSGTWTNYVLRMIIYVG